MTYSIPTVIPYHTVGACLVKEIALINAWNALSEGTMVVFFKTHVLLPVYTLPTHKTLVPNAYNISYVSINHEALKSTIIIAHFIRRFKALLIFNWIAFSLTNFFLKFEQ